MYWLFLAVSVIVGYLCGSVNFAIVVSMLRGKGDIRSMGNYNPGTDPAGSYGGASTPTPANLTNGQDALGIHISMDDPSGPPASPVAWGTTGKKDAEWFKRLSAAVRRAAASR